MRTGTGKKTAILGIVMLLLLLGSIPALATELPIPEERPAPGSRISSDIFYVAENLDFPSHINMVAATPCWVDWEEEVPESFPVLADSGPVYIYSNWPSETAFMTYQVEEGSECYLLEPFVDGQAHLVQCDDVQGYISTHQLDLTDSEEAYQYAQGQNLRTLTGYDAETLERCLSDALVGLGETFAQAEQKYNVNALFLISICEFESANGTSALAQSRNNLAGLGGSGNWASFSSFAECVDYLAELLSDSYLNPESSFFHGYTTTGVCQTYCGGSQHWIDSVDRYLQENFDQITEAE